MEVYRISSRLFLLLGLLCLATTLQGVQGGTESEGPSESECRPYIEKALKELEIAESAEPIAPGEDTGGESKEDVSTVEITTDDSDHADGDGDSEDEAEEGKDSTESAEIDQDEATSSKEEADEDQSVEEQRSEEASSEDEQEASNEEGEAQSDGTEEEQSKEGTNEQEEGSGQSAEDETASTEEVQSDEDAGIGSDETGDKKESGEADGSIEDEATEAEGDTDSIEDDKSAEAVDDAQEGDESKELERESQEDGTESAEAEQEPAEQPTDSAEADDPSDSAETEEPSDSAEAEEPSDSIEAEEPSDSTEVEKSGEDTAEEEPAGDEPAGEGEPSTESVDDKSAESADDISAESADGKSAEEADTSVLSDEEGESVEDAGSDGVDEEHAAETGGEDSKEAEGDNEPSSDEEAKEEENVSKEDDSDGDHSSDAEQDSASEAQKDEASTEEAVKEVSQELEADSPQADEPQADEPAGEEARSKEQAAEEAESEGGDKEALEETAAEEEDEAESEEKESAPEEELINEGEIPDNLRPTEHLRQLLKLDDENTTPEKIVNGIAEITLRDLKKLYEHAIKPLETLYKYRDLSNRHFGDSEIFSKPLVLFMGPWSGGKSSIINYLVGNEYNETSLRTGAEPSPAYFNILMHGQEPEVLDGTQLAADFTFSGLQKFGQGLEERLRGLKLPEKLLEKINIVEIPGILEVRKQISRVFPFNDACQWFIDRADIIYLVYDPSKLDVGPETEAILDQLKGREHQTRIILNKADQVKPEELMRVQGALIWNISPLMSSAQPPVMYTTSLWSRPYEAWAPVRLLQAQERAFLRDLRGAVDKRIENKIASARRFAVRVRNHAKMVDCYLTTYYNHKSVFGNRKQVSDAIIEHPQDYHIYEGLSTLTNISRYDLPDPDVYRDFFRLNPLYDFQQLSATCTYFRGCPINRLDVAIAYDLPELVGKHKRMVEAALAEANLSQTPGS